MGKIKVDFTGVESYLTADEGQHVAKIVTAVEKPSSTGNDMVVVTFEVVKGDCAGARVRENYPLVSTALFKLKALLEAVGLKADGKIQLDTDKLVGKNLIVEVRHEEYNGSTQGKVAAVKKLVAKATVEDEDDDFEDDEEEVEVPKKAAKKPAKASKTAPKPEPEEEDEDDFEEEEDEEDDEPVETPKEKKARLAKEAADKLAKEAAKNKKAADKKAKEKAAAKAKAKEEDDEDEDEDDWDEE